MHVITLEVAELGNRCHLVHDGAVALVVDPPRHLGPVELAAEEAGVEIAAVADTHLHNDYLSGALSLARRHGADYLLSAAERVDFERVGVRDGEVVRVGHLDVHVLDTPGHTRHHQSFLVSPEAAGSRVPGALFSGGSLLNGTVGRTDLVDSRLTVDLARAQWTSARRLGALDPATRLHPTHGFGSFCASSTAPAALGALSIGDQQASNPALTRDREEFVATLDRAEVSREGFRLGPVDLTVSRGDRIAVAGDNGSGKTTLVKALLGELPLSAGRRSLGTRVRPGVLDQRRSLLDSDASVVDVVRAELAGPDQQGPDRADVRTLLAKFGLGSEHVDRPARTLSMGERTRAMMAVFQASEVNVLVLDEPTNHLDVAAIEQLESALVDYDGKLLVVSHDAALVESLDVTHRWHVADGGVTVEQV